MLGLLALIIRRLAPVDPPVPRLNPPPGGIEPELLTCCKPEVGACIAPKLGCIGAANPGVLPAVDPKVKVELGAVAIMDGADVSFWKLLLIPVDAKGLDAIVPVIPPTCPDVDPPNVKPVERVAVCALIDGAEADPKLKPATVGAGAGAGAMAGVGAGAAILDVPKERIGGSWVVAGGTAPKENEEEGADELAEVFPELNAKVAGLVFEASKLGTFDASALNWNPELSLDVLGTAPKEKPLYAGAAALVPLVPNERGGGIPTLDPNEVLAPPLTSAPIGAAI